MGLKEDTTKLIESLYLKVPLGVGETLSEIQRSINEYDDALRMMVYQYCTYNRNGEEIFSHQFMSAGEYAFELLGIENGQSAEDALEGII